VGKAAGFRANRREGLTSFGPFPQMALHPIADEVRRQEQGA
jgi:hypothetical protein